MTLLLNASKIKWRRYLIHSPYEKLGYTPVSVDQTFLTEDNHHTSFYKSPMTVFTCLKLTRDQRQEEGPLGSASRAQPRVIVENTSAFSTHTPPSLERRVPQEGNLTCDDVIACDRTSTLADGHTWRSLRVYHSGCSTCQQVAWKRRINRLLGKPAHCLCYFVEFEFSELWGKL